MTWFDLTPIAGTTYAPSADDVAQAARHRMTFADVIDAIPPAPFAVSAGQILDALGIPRSKAEHNRLRHFLATAQRRELLDVAVKTIGKHRLNTYTRRQSNGIR